MEVGVFEARNRFSELVEAAERGEEVVVLKRGRPAVRIVAATIGTDIAAKRRIALAMAEELGAAITARNGRRFTHEQLMEGKDEGRR